jgi:hypothetical protein
MRNVYVSFTCLCLILLSAFALAKPEKPSDPMDAQAVMETYQKLATLGEPHKQLAALAGSWTTTTQSWMEPGKPPIKSTGSCEQTMLLGGRFLQQKCTGEMMGHPFTGIGVTGYDNHTKQYVSTWIDTMGTGIFFMEGTASADGKTVTQTGTYDDPIKGKMQLRAVSRTVDTNTHIFEMYGTGKNGKEWKMMEITYTRKG